MRKIFEYCKEGKPVVTEFLNCAPQKLARKFGFLIDQLKDETQPLREPYVKHFSIERYKMFYELRLKSMKTIIRIVFIEADDTIILLHAFYKKNKRDTQAALEQTLKLFSELNQKALLPFEHLREVDFL